MRKFLDFSSCVKLSCSQKCDEYGGQRVQRAEGTKEFGPWLRVASPKRRFGQGSGWLKNRNRDHTYNNHSNDNLVENHSWRGSNCEGGDGRRR